jgi:hypothetical protein
VAPITRRCANAAKSHEITKKNGHVPTRDPHPRRDGAGAGAFVPSISRWRAVERGGRKRGKAARMNDNRDPDDDDEPDEAGGRSRFSRFGEQLSGLLDPEGAFRRGQNMVTGMTNATKEELMRIVSAEVRSFLDKMDAADLIQQVIAGLVVDVNMQVRFSRDDPDKPAQPHITRSETKVGVRDDGKRDKKKKPEADPGDRDD